MRNLGAGILAAAMTAVAFASPLQAQPYGGGYGPGHDMMGGWGYGYGAIHMIVWVVILIAIIVGIVWLVRSIAAPGGRLPRRSAGLDVIEERYARGEINRDEYLQKKKDILG
jgi:putative membrane protein